jgi:hydrogenase maturation protease
MKTIIIGLGNPILGDDGVGWRVAEEVSKVTSGQADVEVDCFALGGLSLMERLTGCDRAILIDSIFTGKYPIGSVSQFPLCELPDVTGGHTSSVHDTSLRNALNVGRCMKIHLPQDKDVAIVAIETENIYDFSETLSPPVEAAIPFAVKTVIELLGPH